MQYQLPVNHYVHYNDPKSSDPQFDYQRTYKKGVQIMHKVTYDSHNFAKLQDNKVLVRSVTAQITLPKKLWDVSRGRLYLKIVPERKFRYGPDEPEEMLFNELQPLHRKGKASNRISTFYQAANIPSFRAEDEDEIEPIFINLSAAGLVVNKRPDSDESAWCDQFVQLACPYGADVYTPTEYTVCYRKDCNDTFEMVDVDEFHIHVSHQLAGCYTDPEAENDPYVLPGEDKAVDKYNAYVAYNKRHHAKLVAIEKKVVAIEGKMEAIDERLPNMENKVDSIDERMPSIEHKVKSIDKRMPIIENKVKSMGERLPSIDNKIQSIDESIPNIDASIDGLDWDLRFSDKHKLTKF